ncbi:Vitelline membrane outer layer protein I (VOMI) [Pseudocohnilembus persalinus]|uniref:Vitelline membrane outer layer protein I (VOMI) n=1 Tax=Pseudocohnilembus persalinus TaxID=266149 RepID=A0A0V0QR59_PSEPJ|nr:Vitelline membrane outer layer protein I (VOMI) [Pseudocohnilembus persalinus]|eukprot:KRX04767.1 Vitelline membrane outer layer protein I (VOMI) [Pseudocohnilembus persalinus]
MVLCKEKVEKQKKLKLSTRGLPKRSPTLVLTTPQDAQLRSSNGIRSTQEQNLETIHDGSGDWKTLVKAPNNYLACGAQYRYEGKDIWTDDSGGNGLRLIFCNINDWSQLQKISLNEGNSGEWGNDKKCEYGQFITGIKYYLSDSVGIDGFHIYCNYTQLVNVKNGDWDETLKEYNVNNNQYVCGGQTKFHTDTFDSYGIDGIRLQYCSYYCSSHICTSCDDKFYLKNNQCIDCDNTCATCVNDASYCLSNNKIIAIYNI